MVGRLWLLGLAGWLGCGSTVEAKPELPPRAPLSELNMTAAMSSQSWEEVTRLANPKGDKWANLHYRKVEEAQKYDTCRMCSMPGPNRCITDNLEFHPKVACGDGPQQGEPFNATEGIPSNCLRVTPCDVAGRFKLARDWACALDHKLRPNTGWQPPFYTFDLVGGHRLATDLSCIPSRGAGNAPQTHRRDEEGPLLQERAADASSMFAHGDYVLTVDEQDFPLAAACWRSGERGEGCGAFPNETRCDLASDDSHFCLLFRDAVPVGDVVLQFTWEKPIGRSCNLLEDKLSGWRKELRAAAYWGNKASVYFHDARVAVASELSFYETEVRIKEECPDLLNALWTRMSVDYDYVAFNGSVRTEKEKMRAKGDVQASLELKEYDRLARVDIMHYGFSTLGEFQVFAAFLPEYTNAHLDPKIVELFHKDNGWLQIAQLAQTCYRNSGIKLLSVTRDINEQTLRAPGQLMYDAATNDTEATPRNWPRARAYVRIKSKKPLDPGLCTKMAHAAFTDESSCHMERPHRKGATDSNGADLKVHFTKAHRSFNVLGMLRLLGGMAVVVATFRLAEEAWTKGKQMARPPPLPLTAVEIAAAAGPSRPEAARLRANPNDNLLGMEPVSLIGTRDSQTHRERSKPTVIRVDSLATSNRSPGDFRSLPRAAPSSSSSAGGAPVAAARRQPQLHRVVFDGKVRLVTDEGIEERSYR